MQCISLCAIKMQFTALDRWGEISPDWETEALISFVGLFT